METKKIDFERAYNFGFSIITRTDDCIDFAAEMIYSFGEEIAAYCKKMYLDLMSEVHHYGPEKIAELKLRLIAISEDSFFEAYEELKNRFDKVNVTVADYSVPGNLARDVELLRSEVRQHANSKEFIKMIKNISSMPGLSIYNALLVQWQRPGSILTLQEKKWNYYGRRLKPNAQPLMILKKFGPVDFVYEYDDTEKILGLKGRSLLGRASKEEAIELYKNNLLDNKGCLSLYEYNMLCKNIETEGIYLDCTFRAGNNYGGYITHYDNQELRVRISKDKSETVRSKLLINVNENFDLVSKFGVICHELGHLFCEHISYNEKVNHRFTKEQEEFEAETVSWLVCRALGIERASEKYLAGYDDEFPECDLAKVAVAVDRIIQMTKRIIPVKDSYRYKNDPKFREFIWPKLLKAKAEREMEKARKEKEAKERLKMLENKELMAVV